jgi:hypothetical protein
MSGYVTSNSCFGQAVCEIKKAGSFFSLLAAKIDNGVLERIS